MSKRFIPYRLCVFSRSKGKIIDSWGDEWALVYARSREEAKERLLALHRNHKKESLHDFVHFGQPAPFYTDGRRGVFHIATEEEYIRDGRGAKSFSGDKFQ